MDIKKFVTSYKKVVLTIAFVLLVIGFAGSKSVPIINDIFTTNNEYTNAQNQLKDKEQQLSDLKDKIKKAKDNEVGAPKQFYRSIDKGLDTEAVIANEFGEIIALLRSHSIKARSVSYEYDPKDDNFVKNAGNEYSVARLNIEMIGTYKNFEGLLKEMFKHEHFLDIVSFDIVPYEKNKRILIIKMQLKLYAQKN